MLDRRWKPAATQQRTKNINNVGRLQCPAQRSTKRNGSLQTPLEKNDFLNKIRIATDKKAGPSKRLCRKSTTLLPGKVEKPPTRSVSFYEKAGARSFCEWPRKESRVSRNKTILSFEKTALSPKDVLHISYLFSNEALDQLFA